MSGRGHCATLLGGIGTDPFREQLELTPVALGFRPIGMKKTGTRGARETEVGVQMARNHLPAQCRPFDRIQQSDQAPEGERLFERNGMGRAQCRVFGVDGKNRQVSL